MPKIVTVAEMIAIEKAADAAGHSYAAMMDLAGQAVAERIVANLPRDLGRPARILILVGKGNNGGDGLVAGRYVREVLPDAEVHAYLTGSRPAEDGVFADAVSAGVGIMDEADLRGVVFAADCIVDAVFGTGIHLPLREDSARLFGTIAEALAERAKMVPRARNVNPGGAPGADDAGFQWMQGGIPRTDPRRPRVIAVDCPSGMDCDTGEVDRATLPADETVTFAAAKWGQVRFPGADYCGQLFVADIGIVPDNAALEPIKAFLPDAREIKLPTRASNSHKGTYGKALIVAGSQQFIGAAALSADAAIRSGAGLVTVATAPPLISILASRLAEPTWLPLPHQDGNLRADAADIIAENARGYDALLVGCGIGNTAETQALMRTLIQKGVLPPLVIDADGLNALAQIGDWRLPANTILTPHPREFARLIGESDTGRVVENRVTLAREYAEKWGCVVLLKGAYSVIAAPDGTVTINPFATDKLATAGTGDVLAGGIVGLLAQGAEPYQAAVAGAWLHGWAGQHGLPDFGGAASDVIGALGKAFQVVREAGR